MQPGGLAGAGNLLARYAVLARKSVGETLRLKANQLIFGNRQSRYGAAFKGLFDSLRDYSPPRESIFNSGINRLKNGGGIKISPTSYKRADAILKGSPSGAFMPFLAGGVRTQIRIVRINSKGKRISARKAALGKNHTAVRGNARELKPYMQAGDKILNRQALAAAIELYRRESAIGFWGIPFLPNRYRTFLKRNRGTEYRSGNAVGTSAADLYLTHEHGRRLIRNVRGDVLGDTEFVVNGDSGFFSIKTEVPGLLTEKARRIIEPVIGHVKRDIMEYILRKGKER